MVAASTATQSPLAPWLIALGPTYLVTVCFELATMPGLRSSFSSKFISGSRGFPRLLHYRVDPVVIAVSI